MGDNRAILEYRRTLRLRVAEYERDMLTGYRLAREVAECGLVQAGLGMETALAGLQRQIGLVRSHLLVLETIAENHPKPKEGESGRVEVASGKVGDSHAWRPSRNRRTNSSSKMPIHRLHESEWVFIVRGSQRSQECGILIACRSGVTYIAHEGNK